MEPSAKIHVSVSDLYHLCCQNPEFFEALIEDPEKTLQNSDYQLPAKCLEQLMNLFHNPAAKDFLEDVLKVAKRYYMSHCVWGTCGGDRLDLPW